MEINTVFTKSIWASAMCIFLMTSFSALSSTNAVQPVNSEQDQWLKARFGAQHEKLIPVVAVADMYFSCQQQKSKNSDITIKALITDVDKNALAEKLIECLDGASPKSDIALNYGLTGCFHEQLSVLSIAEKRQKMALVAKAIASLSRAERQKTFTKCVTEQSISYLK